MPSKGVRKARIILPPGAVWETKTDPCLKCGNDYTRRGYRTKGGCWIGQHLCTNCNISNADIADPPKIIGSLDTEEHVRER